MLGIVVESSRVVDDKESDVLEEWDASEYVFRSRDLAEIGMVLWETPLQRFEWSKVQSENTFTRRYGKGTRVGEEKIGVGYAGYQQNAVTGREPLPNGLRVSAASLIGSLQSWAAKIEYHSLQTRDAANNEDRPRYGATNVSLFGPLTVDS